jgi:transposase
VNEATGSLRDAASVLFDLPGHRVLDAVDRDDGAREVLVASTATEAACPGCGVFSRRVHQRVRQRLRDVPVAGAVDVVLVRRRFVCVEQQCARRTFVEVTDQVPARARLSTRLRQLLLAAVVGSGRVVAEVAAGHRVSWWTVQAVVNAAAERLVEPDDVIVRRLGIDEHRYRSVRFFRDPATARWRRYEPWMTTFVDTTTGRVLGVVDGRNSASVAAWLSARSTAWREAVEVVAIDPSAAFRKALREHLPRAAVSVDAFHLVKLANDALTQVRQRVSREQKQRRGRAIDPSWANRRLLLRAGDTLSARGLARLEATLRSDDPTDEISAAWAVKEQLRRLLRASDLADANHQRLLLSHYVQVAAMPETTRLLATVNTWWETIEVLVVTGVTNARTEAANTSIKQLKRTGRGYRNPGHYRARILLASAARSAA